MPRAEKKVEKKKFKEGAPDAEPKKKKVKGDPLGEPPPWTANMPEPSASSAEAAASVPAEESSSSSTAPGDVAATSPVSAKDEIVTASPKLAEHIKSAGKFNKVATMACSLLEEGRVTLHNSEAFVQVLEAGMADPKRLREKQYRVAFRRLYSAAVVSGPACASPCACVGQWARLDRIVGPCGRPLQRLTSVCPLVCGALPSCGSNGRSCSPSSGRRRCASGRCE